MTVHNCVVEMTVVRDPNGLFEPGDRYTKGDIALWLEEEMLTPGLVLHNGHEWTVTQTSEGLRLAHGDAYLTPADVRNWRRRNHSPPVTPAPTRDRVLLALRDLTAELGQPPTHREMGARLDKAPSLVRYHLMMLEADGYVTRRRWKWRACHLTAAGEAYCEAL